MGACIEREHGIIDKYIGDSVMAVWGPLSGASDHAAADAFPERFGVDAGFYAQREAFSERLRDRAVHHLVDELADAAAPQRTGV